MLSDTHIPTRAPFISPRIYELFEGAELILHAGDLVEMKMLAGLASIAPVEAVAGNMDPPELARALGRCKIICTGTIIIGLVHGDGEPGISVEKLRAAFMAYKPQVIVFGHSHQPYKMEQAGVLMFNPGSATDPRRVRRPSCGVLTVRDNNVQGEIYHL